eukprot:509067-Alexandrium_andersonii.AAC.1
MSSQTSSYPGSAPSPATFSNCMLARRHERSKARIVSKSAFPVARLSAIVGLWVVMPAANRRRARSTLLRRAA